MGGYIGSKAVVTQVDGYNRNEADSTFPKLDGNNTLTGDNTLTGTLTGVGARQLLAYQPGHYSRSRRWKIKSTADRTVLVSPDAMGVNIDGMGYVLSAAVEINVNTEASWDAVAPTDYTVAAHRAGKDFYIYACVPSSGAVPDIVLSANSTFPSGYTADNSRKVGGFHCVCKDIGTDVYPYENEAGNSDHLQACYIQPTGISNGDIRHWLRDYLEGDILPLSVWDLSHKVNDDCDPEGHTYIPGLNRWVMIYLPSWDNATKKAVSVYGGSVVTGTTTPAHHANRWDQVFGQQGAMSPSRQEFQIFSLGSPQGVNISTGANPGTTGGHVATNGQRIVSLHGVEDAVGVFYQWSRDTTENSQETWGDSPAFADSENFDDANDKNVGGHDYSLPRRSLFGVLWSLGVRCGSRGAYSGDSALRLHSSYAGRGVAEPHAGRA